LAYYIDSKQLNAAESILHEQVAARPSDVELRKTLATVLFQQVKHVEVRSVLEDVLEHDPDDVEMLTMLGTTLLELDDLANASTYLQRALALDPNNTLAAQALQQVSPQQTSPPVSFSFRDGNLTISGDASQLSSDDMAAGMTAAILLGTDPDAVEARLAELAESDPELARKVASLLQGQGLPTTQPPQLARQHLERAEHMFGQARWEEAVEAYRLAIEADPNLAEAYMGWGDVHYRRGEYYLAIAYFEESLSIEPSPYAYRFLGDALHRIGKPKQAAEAYRQALKVDPNYSGARMSLQELLERGIEDEEATAPN
jgi:tetratricopeptide (TPR) repeat protein